MASESERLQLANATGKPVVRHLDTWSQNVHRVAVGCPEGCIVVACQAGLAGHFHKVDFIPQRPQ